MSIPCHPLRLAARVGVVASLQQLDMRAGRGECGVSSSQGKDLVLVVMRPLAGDEAKVVALLDEAVLGAVRERGARVAGVDEELAPVVVGHDPGVGEEGSGDGAVRAVARVVQRGALEGVQLGRGRTTVDNDSVGEARARVVGAHAFSVDGWVRRGDLEEEGLWRGGRSSGQAGEEESSEELHGGGGGGGDGCASAVMTRRDVS